MTLKCGSAALTGLEHELPGSKACEYKRVVSGTCSVTQVGKFRNGAPKAWCRTHAELVRPASASECLKVGTILTLRCLSLDIDQYPGGIGIWGALPPAIDTADSTMDEESLLKGVHVHARPHPKAKKEVDETYDIVALFRANELLIVIDSDSATSMVQSRLANLQTARVECRHCGAVHIDEGWFAVNPHRKHQCMCCGREFYQQTAVPGSAIEDKLREVFPVNPKARSSPNRTIDLARHLDAGRHIRIWGTHQALVWTADRPEESGVHVHVYNSRGEYVVDETFDKALWQDQTLDATDVRRLMLQKSLPHLEGRIEAAKCNSCGVPLFSEGKAAVNASTSHVCSSCGAVNRSKRKVVMNPLHALKIAACTA